jgi:hypothetical protein
MHRLDGTSRNSRKQARVLLGCCFQIYLLAELGISIKRSASYIVEVLSTLTAGP